MPSVSKALEYISVAILLVMVVSAILLFRACNSGDLYQAGSGLGTLAYINKEKYKADYLKQYSDTFFKVYPHYKLLKDDRVTAMTDGYEFLDMTNFYFSKYPRETYCVQMSNLSVRFAYNYETDERVVENRRANLLISEAEKERRTKRLRMEVFDRIDSIIASSKDSSIAIWKPPI